MSLFSDVVDEVYTLTNRSDLSAETALCVKQATLDAHRSDLYPRDRTELQLTITPASSIWQIDIPASLPNWRKFSYLRPYDVTTASLAKIVIGRNDFLEPDAILDEYLEERLNIAYVAGTYCNVRLEAAYDGLIVGYWANPILSPANSYNSWIANEQEGKSLIVIDATRRVFNMIGYDEAAARLNIMLFGSSAGAWQRVEGGLAALFKSMALESAGG